MELVVGTYEELILGYKVDLSENDGTFQPSFTDNNHVASVKAVAISTRGVLASGSSDETIRLFNLNSRVELGSLMQHKGSVTCLEFYKGSHLFSTSEDGTICIWQTSNWECLKTLKGHKGAVHSISVHPSGKLALSVGKDKTLRTWNLVTGRSAFITNVKEVANIVKWSPEGDTYSVVFERRIDIYKLESASVCYTILSEFKIHAAAYISNDQLIFGGEEGRLEAHDVCKKQEICKYSTDTNRVKGIAVQQTPSDVVIATTSSDGYVKIFGIKSSKGKINLTEKSAVLSKFRPLCIAIKSEKINKVEQASNDNKKKKERKKSTMNEKSDLGKTVNIEIAKNGDTSGTKELTRSSTKRLKRGVEYIVAEKTKVKKTKK